MMTLTEIGTDECMQPLDVTYHTGGAVPDFLILQLG